MIAYNVGVMLGGALGIALVVIGLLGGGSIRELVDEAGQTKAGRRRMTAMYMLLMVGLACGQSYSRAEPTVASIAANRASTMERSASLIAPEKKYSPISPTHKITHPAKPIHWVQDALCAGTNLISPRSPNALFGIDCRAKYERRLMSSRRVSAASRTTPTITRIADTDKQKSWVPSEEYIAFVDDWTRRALIKTAVSVGVVLVLLWGIGIYWRRH